MIGDKSLPCEMAGISCGARIEVSELPAPQPVWDTEAQGQALSRHPICLYLSTIVEDEELKG